MTNNQKMTVGVLVNNYSFRPDIRSLIDELSNHYDLVCFCEKNDYDLLPDKLSKKLIPRVSVFWNSILDKLFKYFGVVSTNRDNVVHYLRHDANKTYKKTSRLIIEKIKIEIRIRLPKIFSYDFFLSLRDTSFLSQLEVDNIDLFIGFTGNQYNDFYSFLQKKKKRLFLYVHSWDHPSKYNNFPKLGVKYLCWNGDMAKDMMSFHGIPLYDIHEIGVSQFTVIKEFLVDKKNGHSPKEDFIYYIATWAQEEEVIEEIKIIKLLARKIKEYSKSCYLLFRPYPNIKMPELYDQLRSIDNIIFDNYTPHKKIKISDQDNNHKLRNINSCRGVFHSGTTVGLETSFFDTPVFYFNLKSIEEGGEAITLRHVAKSWTQYHLKSYYDTDHPNVIKSMSALSNVIQRCLNGDSKLLDYNRELRNRYDLKSMPEIVSDLSTIFHATREESNVDDYKLKN